MKLLLFLLTLSSLLGFRESTDNSVVPDLSEKFIDKCPAPELLWAWTTKGVSKGQICPLDGDQKAIYELPQGESTVSVPTSSDLTAPTKQRTYQALEAAIRRGDKKGVSDLLPGITDLNSRNRRGWGPLHIAAHYAAHEASLAIVKMLIEKGFDPNIQGPHGWTPLHVAASENTFEIVQLLIKNDADPHKVAGSKVTALHVAAVENSYRVIEPLIEAGANLNAYTKDGNSPLELAIRLNALEVVQLLIRTEAYQSKTSTWIKFKLLGAAMYSKNFKMIPLLFMSLPPKRFTVKALSNYD